MSYFTSVFTIPQSNNSDSYNQRSSITEAETIRPSVSSQNSANKLKPLKETISDKKEANDSKVILGSTSKQLFTVPYRCTLNRDSLRAEMRKVVLEIDTIPKGLNIIVAENLKDTTLLKTTPFSKSIFTHHLLQPKNFELKPKVGEQQNWVFVTILTSLFLVGILRVFYQKKFSLFVNAIISKRFSNQIIREENALTQSTSVVLTAVFFISITMFFYLVTQHFHQSFFGYVGFQKFSMILLSCICFYFLKLLTNKASGYIFKVNKETDEYIFNQFIVLQILGLLLIICCIILRYSVDINKEFVIYFGFGTLMIGFIIRMIKSFGIANMNSYSPVYIFLYLCTLEILPLIIIVKLIMRKIFTDISVEY